MANRNWASGGKLYSMHVMPILLDGHGNVNATGGIDGFVGPVIHSVAKVATGIYKIKLQDNYSGLYDFSCNFDAPLTGSAIDPNGATLNRAYVITVVGDTDWASAGLNPGIVPAVGVSYFQSAAPAVGTGRVKAFSHSGIASAELIGNPNLSLAPQQSQNQGGELLFQCVSDAGAVADPASGSVMRIQLYLSNSSVLIGGE